MRRQPDDKPTSLISDIMRGRIRINIGKRGATIFAETGVAIFAAMIITIVALHLIFS
jgi:hypothetical protein